jgi:hypothetical protein
VRIDVNLFDAIVARSRDAAVEQARRAKENPAKVGLNVAASPRPA